MTIILVSRLYRMSQEKKSIFSEATVWAILSRKSVRFPRYGYRTAQFSRLLSWRVLSSGILRGAVCFAGTYCLNLQGRSMSEARNLGEKIGLCWSEICFTLSTRCSLEAHIISAAEDTSYIYTYTLFFMGTVDVDFFSELLPRFISFISWGQNPPKKFFHNPLESQPSAVLHCRTEFNIPEI